MNIVSFFIIMFLGIVAYLVVVWATFADFVGMLMKFFRVREPKGYNVIRKLRDSKQFKVHKVKWIKIYLLLVFVYIGCYVMLVVFVKDLYFSFLVSLVLLVFCSGFAANVEGKQRKNIEKELDI